MHLGLKNLEPAKKEPHDKQNVVHLGTVCIKKLHPQNSFLINHCASNDLPFFVCESLIFINWVHVLFSIYYDLIYLKVTIKKKVIPLDSSKCNLLTTNSLSCSSPM